MIILTDIRRGVALLALPLVLGVGAACGGDGGVDPQPALEALPTTTATVQAAVELRSTGPIVIPVNCGGTYQVNCAGGTPGSPVSVSVTRTNLVVTPTTTTEYTFSMDLAVATLQNIPVTYGGVTCGVSVNSAAGASPTIHVTGTAEFASHTGDGTLNRIDLIADASGFEEADISITGSPFCQTGAFAGLAADVLNQSVADFFGSLCGVEGPELFGECPETPTAAPRMRRAR